jgi:hypothetical protein
MMNTKQKAEHKIVRKSEQQISKTLVPVRGQTCVYSNKTLSQLQQKPLTHKNKTNRIDHGDGRYYDERE